MYKDIQVKDKRTHPLNLNNSGTLNEQSLQFAKKTMLFDLVREHANELIKHTQHYPQGDISDVDLEADFVIMTYKEYKKLSKNKESKILKFPKLKV